MSQQQQNPYAAQQTYTAVPGMGSSGPQQGAPQGGYSAQGAYQQYGQQDGYDTRPGGAGGVPVQQVVGMNGAGATDFWGELTATNASLNEMQDAIQQVRQAHVASLVSPPPPAPGVIAASEGPCVDRHLCVFVSRGSPDWIRPPTRPPPGRRTN